MLELNNSSLADFPRWQASLAMYLWPGVEAAAQDFLDLAVRSMPEPVPSIAALDFQKAPKSLWGCSDLFLAQACGYPYAAGFCGRAQVLATPEYDVPFSDGTMSRSVIIASTRKGMRRKLVEGCWAVNSLSSQSGYHAMRLMLMNLGAPRKPIEYLLTGSHQASVTQVAQGRADFAAIDCVTYALLLKHQPKLSGEVQVVGQSGTYPSLPLISTLPAPERQELFVATKKAVHSKRSNPYCETLGLCEISKVPEADYAVLFTESQRCSRYFKS